MVNKQKPYATSTTKLLSVQTKFDKVFENGCSYLFKVLGFAAELDAPNHILSACTSDFKNAASLLANSLRATE